MRYKLNASNIDAVSKEVNAYLVRRNTEDKDRVHTKLSVEEVLLDYMTQIDIDYGGARYNPFEHEDGGLGVTILKNMSRQLDYRYTDNRNRISINL